MEKPDAVIHEWEPQRKIMNIPPNLVPQRRDEHFMVVLDFTSKDAAEKFVAQMEAE